MRTDDLLSSIPAWHRGGHGSACSPGSVTPSWSPWRSCKRCWVTPRSHAGCATPVLTWGICSAACLASLGTTGGCAERAAPDRVCIEFRNRTWMTPGNQDETLGFLAEHRLPYMCVEMPQGHRDSIPPVLAATAPDLAVVRLHGHSDRWESKDIHERFGYRYTETELEEWAPKVAALAGDAENTHVLFNNCYRDYAQVNAQRLAELLRSPAHR
jgi:uncharacterized protein YecE (DUF72 family)